LLELVTAGLVVLAAVRYPNPWHDVLIGGLLALMPGIALIDLRYRIIPNKITYPAALIFPPVILLAWLIGDAADPVKAVLGFLSFGGGILIVASVSGGMGLGDVKLAAVIGLVLGSLGLRFVAVSAGATIVLGGFGGLIALAMGRGMKTKIPYGPYLAAGAIVAGLWGDPLASWYLDRFV
jgi:leader peptidase (prepilin peptidase)/N-methyltransferase